ncbi:MAG TPA: hypothetical protein PK955_00820 [Methanoregulaceae archaeon]|nr:hypothetical protein [Methanoregulaceae archaeon]
MSAVIAPFNESVGIVKVNAGYTDVCSVNSDDLRLMIEKLKPGQDIRLAYVPHEDGSNVALFKARDADYWIGIAPVRQTAKGRVQMLIDRVLCRGE